MQTLEIEVLVELLECVAKLDKTSPDVTNPRVGWSTDTQLKFIEDLVVVDMNDPATYAEICRRAWSSISLSSGMDEIEALLELAIFNAERRVSPGDPERKDILLSTIAELSTVIFSLPKGTRKMRCKSLLEYHSGVFYNDYGRYDFAAEAHGRGAQEAERLGDTAGVAISRFLEVFYGLKYMLCVGQSDNQLNTGFIFLEIKFNELTEALRGTSLEVQWAEHNCPAHMIQACTWLGINHAKWDEWVKTTLAAAKKRGCESGSDLICALDLARRNSPKAVNALYSVIKQDNDNERIATAYLALARYFLAHDAKNKAIELVDNMPRQGAQHIRAIVEKLLAD